MFDVGDERVVVGGHTVSVTVQRKPDLSATRSSLSRVELRRKGVSWMDRVCSRTRSLGLGGGGVTAIAALGTCPDGPH